MRICIDSSLGVADIPASEIGYISAHGTGTLKGDVAEIQATAQVY